MSLPTFNPSPAIADAVLDDLANPALSARDAAARANTTLPALARWFTRDDIQKHFRAITATADALTNHLAAANLRAVAQAAVRIVDDFNSRPRPTPTSAQDPAVAAANFRAANHMLRAGHLLLRLAKFSGDAPVRTRTHNAPEESREPARRRAQSPDHPAKGPSQRDDFLALAAQLAADGAPLNPPATPAAGANRNLDHACIHSIRALLPSDPSADSFPVAAAIQPPSPSAAPSIPSVLSVSAVLPIRPARQSRAAHLARAAGLLSGP
ncbi:hypothetical protein PHYC_01652 [Phycisphaerales bacterium]|nr:hypothetical protein PHYC_01652 [Phycisphaerales bacterium]